MRNTGRGLCVLAGMRPAAIIAIAGASLLAAGCVRYERQDTSESKSVEAGDATSAQVEIEMGAGEIRIEGAGGKLLEADFRYSVPEWKPEVRYNVSAGRGYLSIRQPSTRAFAAGNQDNRWDLRLNDHLPLDIRINLGAGEGKMKLSGMALRRLDVDIGAGALQLDLTGPWDQDLEGHVRGGVGETTLKLPREAGVRVEAHAGLGGIKVEGLEQTNGYYVNSAYGKSRSRLRLYVNGGIGQINLLGS